MVETLRTCVVKAFPPLVPFARVALDFMEEVLAIGAKTIGATPAVFKLFVSLLVRFISF